MEKKCSKCGKDSGDFGSRRDRVSQLNSWCNDCYSQYQRDRYANDPEYRERCKQHQRNTNLKLKLQVCEAYGGCKCVCCGEDNHHFLTLDHKKNNGGKQRAHLKKMGSAYYRYLVTNDFPNKEDYQVLCYNCNCARAHNKGVCPHQQQVDNLLTFTTEI